MIEPRILRGLTLEPPSCCWGTVGLIDPCRVRARTPTKPRALEKFSIEKACRKGYDSCEPLIGRALLLRRVKQMFQKSVVSMSQEFRFQSVTRRPIDIRNRRRSGSSDRTTRFIYVSDRSLYQVWVYFQGLCDPCRITPHFEGLTHHSIGRDLSVVHESALTKLITITKVFEKLGNSIIPVATSPGDSHGHPPGIVGMITPSNVKTRNEPIAKLRWQSCVVVVPGKIVEQVRADRVAHDIADEGIARCRFRRTSRVFL